MQNFLDKIFTLKQKSLSKFIKQFKSSGQNQATHNALLFFSELFAQPSRAAPAPTSF